MRKARNQFFEKTKKLLGKRGLLRTIKVPQVVAIYMVVRCQLHRGQAQRKEPQGCVSCITPLHPTLLQQRLTKLVSLCAPRIFLFLSQEPSALANWRQQQQESLACNCTKPSADVCAVPSPLPGPRDQGGIHELGRGSCIVLLSRQDEVCCVYCAVRGGCDFACVVGGWMAGWVAWAGCPGGGYDGHGWLVVPL